MAVQSNVYDGDSLSSKTFPATKPIPTKQHMAVWIRELAEPKAWVQMDASEYQLINNSCVLNTELSVALYDSLELRVADTSDELLDSPSDTATVAANIDEVVVVANNIDDVVTVADFIVNVNTVAADLDLGIGTNQPEDSAILNALTNAGIAITKAGEASDSATAAGTSETNAQLFEWEAEAERLTADSYATEAEDTEVNIVTSDGDGTFTSTPQTGVYSALHYAAKSATFNPALYALLTGAIFTGQVKGITPIAAADLTRKDYVEAQDLLRVPKTGVQDTEDWDGTSYTDGDAIGANPTAKIYPNGTVVGSTDNGNYVKFPDGTLLQYGDITSSATVFLTAPFSATFINIERAVSLAIYGSTSTSTATEKTTTMTTTSFNYAVVTGTGFVALNLKYQAIGRWK